MDLNDLGIFCDVALHGSFSKAAAIHDLSQPTVTQKVQNIERHLGVSLLDRKRPLVLTSAGRVFYTRAKALLEDYRALEDAIQQVRDRVVGHVQIVAIYSVGLLQMEECLREFHELYPETRAEIRYEHPETVVEQVLGGSADVGILSFPEEKQQVVVTPWQEQPFVLVVSPQHRLATRSVVSIRDIAGQPFIGFTDELTIRKRIDKWLREQHVAVKVVQAFDNIGQIKEGIGDGTGVAILPAPTVRREVEAGILVAIPFSDVNWVRPLGLIHRRQKSVPTAVQRFIQLLTSKPAASGPAAKPDVTLPSGPSSPASGLAGIDLSPPESSLPGSPPTGSPPTGSPPTGSPPGGGLSPDSPVLTSPVPKLSSTEFGTNVPEMMVKPGIAVKSELTMKSLSPSYSIGTAGTLGAKPNLSECHSFSVQSSAGSGQLSAGLSGLGSANQSLNITGSKHLAKRG